MARADEIGDLARAFQARTEALQKVLDRERFFTGDVSHELRTPLTVIMGAAEIVQANADRQPVLQEAAERILRTAREAADAITVLLLLGARNRSVLMPPRTLVSRIVTDEIQKHQALVDNKPVVLTHNVLRDFSVYARPELLAALIGNLIRQCLSLYTGRRRFRSCGFSCCHCGRHGTRFAGIHSRETDERNLRGSAIRGCGHRTGTVIGFADWRLPGHSTGSGKPPCRSGRHNFYPGFFTHLNGNLTFSSRWPHL